MTSGLNGPLCGGLCAGAWCVLGFGAQQSFAQTPTPPPEQPAAAAPTGGQHGDLIQDSDNPGHPKEVSAGGSERKLPDYAGILPYGPISVIRPYVTDAQKWTSDNM